MECSGRINERRYFCSGNGRAGNKDSRNGGEGNSNEYVADLDGNSNE
jgi:hypothetical protein